MESWSAGLVHFEFELENPTNHNSFVKVFFCNFVILTNEFVTYEIIHSELDLETLSETRSAGQSPT